MVLVVAFILYVCLHFGSVLHASAINNSCSCCPMFFTFIAATTVRMSLLRVILSAC